MQVAILMGLAELNACCSVSSSKGYSSYTQRSAEQSKVKRTVAALVLQADFVPDASTDWCFSYWSGNIYDPARAYAQ